MINYALSTGLSIATGDVSTSFLHASLNELVYVQPPTEIRGSVHAPTGKVWRLKKALYGLRSAPRAWSDHIAQVLTDLGLHRCWTDSCLYWSSTHKLWILIYVDDLMVFGNDTDINWFFAALSDRVLLTRTGDLKHGNS